MTGRSIIQRPRKRNAFTAEIPKGEAHEALGRGDEPAQRKLSTSVRDWRRFLEHIPLFSR
jgi:hypothetical protein